MLGIDVKMALNSIRAARWRSLLTMLGIIIGVVSVITIVSLGEGVKKQVSGQINQLGSDLITIRPGKIVKRDSSGKITGVNVLSGFGASTLTEQDLEVIQKTPNVKTVVPASFIAGVLKADGRQSDDGLIIATNPEMGATLNQEIEFGEFFNENDSKKRVAVIGPQIAQQLFQELVPIGKTLQIRGQDFIVRGVFKEFPDNPLTPGANFNSAVFIPYQMGKEITGGSAQIYQVLVKSNDPNFTDPTIEALNNRLREAHRGQDDFTILKQTESLAITNSILNTMTSLVAGIAAVSLFVGGIGVMNIMLVAVTERTHEIGIRKAIGATSGQILGQFLTEATVLSIWGGLIGVGISGLVNFLIRLLTGLEPVITLPVVVLAVAVSMAVGVVFGAVPALKAARRDPIQSLRTE